MYNTDELSFNFEPSLSLLLAVLNSPAPQSLLVVAAAAHGRGQSEHLYTLARWSQDLRG